MLKGGKVMRAKLIVQVTTTLLLASCLTPVDIDVESIGGRIVIAGQVSSVAERSKIEIGITSDANRLPEPVSNAIVELYDDLGNVFEYHEVPEEPGQYILHDVGMPGRKYHVEVTLSGKRYRSADEKMPSAVGVDSAYVKLTNEQVRGASGEVSLRWMAHIRASSQLPQTEEPLYIKWSPEETFIIVPTDEPDPFALVPPNCYVTQNVDPQNITLFDGSTLKTQKVPDQVLATRLIDQSFHVRHYFTVFQSSISHNAFEYWRKVNIVANQVGSIFDSPPAEVRGNMVNINNEDEVVQGYFQAVNETWQRFFVVREDLPLELPVYCEWRGWDVNYASECVDCITARNSSYKVPDWWPR